MLFNSITFFVFLSIVFPLYLLLPHRLQNRMLLLASYIYYGWWDWRLCSLLIMSTGVNYYCGIHIYNNLNTVQKAKRWKLAAIIFNLTLLGIFRYLNFFTAELVNTLRQLGLDWHFESLNIILPIGISFYTFQALSYSFDIYRKELKPTKNIWDFALFISFFPQLLAGPIERAKNLIPQIIQKRTLSIEQFYHGCYLVFWGLFKKVCIADSIAVFVTPVFNQWQVGTYSWVEIIAAVVFFGIQIYCDFSGYSDIARGVANLMGFNLMLNFNLPYFSKSPSEFWRRWHISLSTWFRDYVYIPLGGSRPSKESSKELSISKWIHSKWLNPCIFRNIMITFALSGLWHGANWTFIVWGVYNGLLLIFHKIYTDLLGAYGFYKQWRQSRIYKLIATTVTFIFICYGWLIFRADNLTQAWQMTNTLFKESGAISHHFYGISNKLSIVLSLISVSLLLIIQCFQYVRNDLMWMYNQKYWVIRGLFYFILICLLIIGASFHAKEFIYFQF